MLSTNNIIITFNNLCTKSWLQKFGITNKKKNRFIKYKICKKKVKKSNIYWKNNTLIYNSEY